MSDAVLNGHAPGTPALEPPEAEPVIITVPRDTSFDHALDETAPKPEPVHAEVPELPRLGGERRPIVPQHLRTVAGVRGAAYKYLDAAWFHAAFHALRSPKYLATSAGWACYGLVKLARVQLAWWWVVENSYLRSKAVADGNSPEYRALHAQVIKRRSFRGFVLLGEVVPLLLGLLIGASIAPWWVWPIVAAVTMPPLARFGRPDTRPIITSAVTTPLVRRINTDAIVRAYEVAGLSSTDPKKPADHLSFGSTMTRDALDRGSQVVVYLPYGGTFAKVTAAKAGIASGLDVAESQVYFTKDKKSERRHTLRVLDNDPLAEPAGRTPLLDCKQRSIWQKFPFGLDQFGRKVVFNLMWISLLIGAQPRRGKTFAGRAVALFCALDPYVIADLAEVFGGDPGLWWEVAAERLAGSFPDRYTDATPESVRSSCAKRGVSSVDVRMPPGRDGTKKRGVRKTDLDGADRR